MFQTKFVKKIKTQILDLITFSENSVFHETMSKNIVELNRPQIIKYCACTLHAGCLRLQTHSRNAVTLIAFPLQQWLYDRTSMLHYSSLPVLLYTKWEI